MRKLTFVAAILACLVTPVAAQTAKQVLTIDVPNDAATLDPHLQWDTDSYGVYRNIFDNLLTRDATGKIVPQIARTWRFVDDTHVEFDIRADVKFHDGIPLSAEDVVFSVKRITNPAFKSPQLSQFDQVADAEALGPTKVRLTLKKPYPVLLALARQAAIQDRNLPSGPRRVDPRRRPQNGPRRPRSTAAAGRGDCPQE